MKIYTYQPQELIYYINTHGFAPVIFEKTNLYKQTQAGTGSPLHHDAYMWMARKLGEKTGIWMKSIYGNDLDLPKDSPLVGIPGTVPPPTDWPSGCAFHPRCPKATEECSRVVAKSCMAALR